MLSSLSPPSSSSSRNHHHHHHHDTAASNDEVQKRLDENIQFINEEMPNCLPTHIVVQQLNSRASYHMERGEYSKAIPMLVSALKLWDTIDHSSSYSSSSSTSMMEEGVTSCTNENSQHQQEEEGNSGCSCCSSCTLDECILQSSANNNNSRSRRQHSSSSRFVYDQPIATISKLCQSDLLIEGGGRTISLILILNLAIAHHNYGIETEVQVDMINNKEKKRALLSKALQLYELAHQLQKEANICSPFVTMIISNNVGEIHYLVQNYEKHDICLQHLLSTMMYIVDHQSRRLIPQQQQQSQSYNDLYCCWWDGFLRNTSHLILQDHCAEAA